MGSANESQHYNATSALIGWAHTQNDPYNCGNSWKLLPLSWFGRLHGLTSLNFEPYGCLFPEYFLLWFLQLNCVFAIKILHSAFLGYWHKLDYFVSVCGVDTLTSLFRIHLRTYNRYTWGLNHHSLNKMPLLWQLNSTSEWLPTWPKWDHILIVFHEKYGIHLHNFWVLYWNDLSK